MFFLLPLLFNGVAADEIYTATFYNSTGGMIGSATINQGRISVELTSTEGVDQECYQNGYGWHIHEGDSFPNGEGWGFGDDCNYADQHYDPGVACSDLSAHGACQCLIPVRENNTDVYDCQFPIDPFTCEFGDFSNKFEGGYVGGDPNYGYGEYSFEDPYLTNDFPEGKSMVFHCGTTAQRAFCSGFTKSYDDNFSGRVKKTTSDEPSLMADFGFGHVQITDFETIVSDFDLDTLATLDEHLPDLAECYADGFKWHIHNEWLHSESAAVGSELCGSAYTGGHYDPTAACGSASGNQECGTCGLNATYACDFQTDPYSCEVGDLGGKFGKIIAGEEGEFTSDFLPGLHILKYKSIVLHCGDSGSRAICAQLTPTDSAASVVSYQNGFSVEEPTYTVPAVNCDTFPGGCGTDLNAASSTQIGVFASALAMGAATLA